MERTRAHWFLITGLACLTLLLFAFPALPARAGSFEQDTLKKLDFIRSIRVSSDDKLLHEYNRQLDEIWEFFRGNKSKVLPILEQQLGIELKKERPNDYFLLDIGSFLYLEGGAQHKPSAKRSLYSIDHTRDLIKQNRLQLFYFAQMVSADRDPAVLPFLDRVFLRNAGGSVFVAQHAMTLDPALMCVFLYGVYGPDSEPHLVSLLKDASISKRIIEILIWIGSDASTAQVKDVMLAQHDYDTFIRGLSYMIQLGGPTGRKIMLAIDPKELDQKTLQYYNSVRNKIASVTYESIKGGLEGFPGDSRLSDDEVKKRLALMYESYGKDEDTNPMAILNSSLPKEYLVGELTKIRSRMLHRVSDEALSDVQMTNTLINALHYRPK